MAREISGPLDLYLSNFSLFAPLFPKTFGLEWLAGCSYGLERSNGARNFPSEISFRTYCMCSTETRAFVNQRL